MEVGAAIRDARLRAGLSARELARRAGTSHATLLAYEAGRVDPGTRVADRILDAAGYRSRLVLEEVPMTLNGRRAGDELVAVLELAEHLPHRERSRRLDAPIFPRQP